MFSDGMYSRRATIRCARARTLYGGRAAVRLRMACLLAARHTLLCVRVRVRVCTHVCMHVCIGLHSCEQSAHAAAAVQSHGHRPLAALARPRHSHAPCTSTRAPTMHRHSTWAHQSTVWILWPDSGVSQGALSQSRGMVFAAHQTHAKEPWFPPLDTVVHFTSEASHTRCSRIARLC